MGVSQHFKKGRVDIQKPSLLAADEDAAARMVKQSLVIFFRGFKFCRLLPCGCDVPVDGQLGSAAVPVGHGQFNEVEGFVQVINVHLVVVGFSLFKHLIVPAPGTPLGGVVDHLVAFFPHIVSEKGDHGAVHVFNFMVGIDDVYAVFNGF